jgi:lipoprotein-anchoring transpeptidase ErfK/SrfK
LEYKKAGFATKIKNKNKKIVMLNIKTKHKIRTTLAAIIVCAGAFGIFYCYQVYPQIFKTSVFVKNTENVLPDEPMEINFSEPIFTGSYADKIAIYPATAVKIAWENRNRKLLIFPQKFWKPETDYKISLPEGKNIMFLKISGTEINFRSIDYPKVAKIFPTDGESNVVLDIEDPIVVNFEKSTENFFLDFRINPNGGMFFQNNPEKTEFKLIPREKIKDGQVYDIKIFARYINETEEDSYKKIYESSFLTLPAPAQIPEKDHALRLLQAKKFTQAKLTDGKYIDINLTTQVLSIFENGKLQDAFMVSTGKKGLETSVGSYQIRNKSPRVWSKAYGLYMPFWMAVAADGKFGIHELPEWPGGYKEGANHLGIPVSHGCIRLGVGPAKQVYDWTEVGTPVVIY